MPQLRQLFLGEIRMKIMIDLDVVTVAEWEKEDPRRPIASRFLDEVDKKIFTVISPVTLIARLLSWKYLELVKKIAIRLISISDSFVTTEEANSILTANTKKGIRELADEGAKGLKIKVSDMALVLIASSKGIDYFVTFNKTDLKNKEGKISEFLRRYNLHTPKIVLPDDKELFAPSSRLSKGLLLFLPPIFFHLMHKFFEFISHNTILLSVYLKLNFQGGKLK